jgi:hypothetical protein
VRPKYEKKGNISSEDKENQSIVLVEAHRNEQTEIIITNIARTI